MKNALCRKENKTISSLEVAEMLGKEHKLIIRDIEGGTDRKGIIQILNENQLEPVNYFIESTYKDAKGETRKCYEVTKMGCEMLGNKQQGEKGILFTAKYVKRFNDMEQLMINQFEGISVELQAIIMQDKKIQQIETKVAELEDNIYISRSQQKKIKTFANEVVVKALGSKHSQAYKEFSGKAFSEFWKTYQNFFNVASYLDTPKKDFQLALQFVNDWKPSKDLHYMIIGANSQMQL